MFSELLLCGAIESFVISCRDAPTHQRHSIRMHVWRMCACVCAREKCINYVKMRKTRNNGSKYVANATAAKVKKQQKFDVFVVAVLVAAPFEVQ